MRNTKIFRFFYIMFLFVSVDLSFAQKPDTLWTKLIGGDSMDVAYDVEELSDGGFAIVGYTKSIPATDYDVWLIRTDSNGNVLWTRTYGGDGDEYGYSMKKAEDGGFILAGTTNSFGAGGFDFYVIRTDSIGDTLWTRTFGGANNDICWSLDKTADGYFVLAGEKNASPLSSDALVIKTDSMGLVVWEKVFGTSNPDYIYSISSSDNGNLSLTGYFYVGFNSGGFDAWLFKMNAFGDSLWSDFYGGDYTERFYSHTITSDQGYICVGYLLPSLGDYPDLFLVKTDSLGNEQWSQTFDYDNDGDIGYSVQQTLDGGYIISGEARPFDGVAEAWVVRTDSQGNILWDKLFPFFPNVSFNNPSDGTHGGNSVKQTSDGGYIIAGYSDKFQGNHLDVYLVRIASDIIPVELTNFTVEVNQNKVTLNWQTATETNNSGFEVQRSLIPNPFSKGEGAFESIGFVPGFGTTTEPKSYSFIDEDLPKGKYQYRLKQIDFDGTFEYSNTVEVEITSPTEFSLEQNYPNSFNPSTNIQYIISGRQFVTLKIFNSLGQELETLVNEFQDAGVHSKLYILNSTLASGVYYYQLRVYPVSGAGSFVETRKMILQK